MNRPQIRPAFLPAESKGNAYRAIQKQPARRDAANVRLRFWMTRSTRRCFSRTKNFFASGPSTVAVTTTTLRTWANTIGSTRSRTDESFEARPDKGARMSRPPGRQVALVSACWQENQPSCVSRRAEDHLRGRLPQILFLTSRLHNKRPRKFQQGPRATKVSVSRRKRT